MNLGSVRLVGLLLALAVAAVAVGIASAAPSEQGKGKSKHDQVVAYWTAERIKNAKPRELLVDPNTGRIVPQKPGGGQAGGGKPGSGVAGAAWTNPDALVKKTTGKVLFTLPSGDYVCSGSIVTDAPASTTTSMVLTAGHCVYDESAGVFATNWMFMPDFESGNGDVRDCLGTQYGCWTAGALVTTRAWAELGNFNEDYAFAVMGQGGTSGTSSLEELLGSQEIVFNQAHPTKVYAFGYPHASPYDGTDLIYCSGTDERDFFGSEDFGLKCNMTGGSSGGPWFVDFDESTGVGKLNSVNSFKYLGGKQKNHMFGPYFDDDTGATYEVAKTATTNALVSTP
jgi:hypothetical protein